MTNTNYRYYYEPINCLIKRVHWKSGYILSQGRGKFYSKTGLEIRRTYVLSMEKNKIHQPMLVNGMKLNRKLR